ncbi:alpha/beta hydrolase [Sphingomonas sp.]|jgi:pimeloyl-ACP methyl ester carboxylesterase|uniref:alpha/beta fold hydrolase n=1 Tax=Sphingomonas sp. TaxID=28214 RepID=UPI002ED8C901
MTRIALPTGVELDVAEAGDPANPALIFLHGFPESHRTWRHQIAALSGDHFCIAPDQRGFARSSKPGAVADYRADRLVADVIALADHYGIDRFTLVAHDWGGAIGWAAALQHPLRVARLVIANAPHPLIFQRSLIDDPAQRAASQYITVFRAPEFENRIADMGLETFCDRSFAPHVDAGKITAADRAAYLDEWRQPGALTAMLNWYRASQIVVPAIGAPAEPPAWTQAPFPVLEMPVLVVWGMRDVALLPVQLDGLDALVRDLTIARIDAGHFVPWDAPDAVTDAMRQWLARD